MRNADSCHRCGKPLLQEHLALEATEARRTRERNKRDVRVIRGGFEREGAEAYRPKPWTGEEAA